MILLDHVFMEYPRSGLALEDVSLHIRQGEFCFLTGNSGAGKSTVLRLIHMSERPTSGVVRVGGYRSGRVRSRDVALLRRKVGFVFQDFRLLRDRTAGENVAFALEVTGARGSVVRRQVDVLLGQVGLADKADAYPGELSGGEQQRVAIARALANEPFVLLADEPTGNLDGHATASVFRLFRRINAMGTAVVFATHALHLLEAAPGIRIIELEQGRAVYDSAHAS